MSKFPVAVLPARAKGIFCTILSTATADSRTQPQFKSKYKFLIYARAEFLKFNILTIYLPFYI